jgi:hypothetical protein
VTAYKKGAKTCFQGRSQINACWPLTSKRKKLPWPPWATRNGSIAQALPATDPFEHTPLLTVQRPSLCVLTPDQPSPIVMASPLGTGRDLH